MILRRGFLQLLLAGLLLVAQQHALSHALQHAQGDQSTQSQQQQHDGSGKQKTQSGMCDYHVSFAQVLGAPGSCAPPLPLPPAAGNQVAGDHQLPFLGSAKLLVPESRGPPVLL